MSLLSKIQAHYKVTANFVKVGIAKKSASIPHPIDVSPGLTIIYTSKKDGYVFQLKDAEELMSVIKKNPDNVMVDINTDKVKVGDKVYQCETIIMPGNDPYKEDYDTWVAVQKWFGYPVPHDLRDKNDDY